MSNLLKLVLRANNYKQKDLARELCVSNAQISKWKAGEYMSIEMKAKLRKLSGIGERDSDLVYWVGGNEQADKWDKLVSALADENIEYGESAYLFDSLFDDVHRLTPCVMRSLINAGAKFPHEFPSELDFDYQSLADEECTLGGLCQDRDVPLGCLINEMFHNLVYLYGFYAAYIEDILFNCDIEIIESGLVDIYYSLTDLALAKVTCSTAELGRFNDFRSVTLGNYEGLINRLKREAFSRSVPLEHELLELVLEEPESLFYAIEAKALGFTSLRGHPDTYMNEILESARYTRKLLTTICKKLGITEADLAKT